MKYAVIIVRILLGLTFFVLGLNHFMGFFPAPELAELPAVAFMDALTQTGYMMPLIKGTETVCGALLLAGIFVPLALVVLAPVMINIVLFSLFLSSPGLPFGLILLALQVFLLWQYIGSFKGLLNPIARSTASKMAKMSGMTGIKS